MLRLSGVRGLDYWLSRFCFDLPHYLIIMLIFYGFLIQPLAPVFCVICVVFLHMYSIFRIQCTHRRRVCRVGGLKVLMLLPPNFKSNPKHYGISHYFTDLLVSVQ